MAKTRERIFEKAPAPVTDAFSSKENGSRQTADAASEAHPLAHLAGKYNDEPIWDDFLQAMQETRREMNAEEEAAEQPLVRP